MVKTLAALSASGMLLATTCSTSQVRAVAAGIDAAAQELGIRSTPDDVTFGEFLLNELFDQ